MLYRGANKGLQILLSGTQAGPGRAVKQEQEINSRNHIQTFIDLFVKVSISNLQTFLQISVPPVRAKIIREWGHFALGQAYNVSCQVSNHAVSQQF